MRRLQSPHFKAARSYLPSRSYLLCASLVIMMLLIGASGTVQAAQRPLSRSPSPMSHIKALQKSLRVAMQSTATDRPQTLEQEVAFLYKLNRYKPLWWVRKRSRCWPALLGRMAHADHDGLRSDDYALDPAQLSTKATSNQSIESELAITGAVVHYLGDLYGRRSRSQLASHATEKPEAYLRHLHRQLRSGKSCAWVQDLGPKHPQYRKLAEILQDLPHNAPPAAVLMAMHRLQDVTHINPARRPSSDQRRNLVTLMRFLGALADAPQGPTSDPPPRAVTDAVRTFQHHAGLQVDGIVGTKTFERITALVFHRPRILATLERWRHFPQSFPKDRHVFINLASGTLKAMVGSRVMMALPLIMGHPKQPTPQFDSTIVNIIFHPSWTVPPDMATAIMVQAQSDPSYLQKRGLQILKNGAVVDLKSVTLQQIAADLKSYRLYQPPGPKNALGNLRFTLDPTNSIHIHGTPDVEAFANDDMYQSAGCLRLSQPALLAHVLLAEVAPERRFDEWLRQPATVGVPLKKPVPAAIRYLTAWVSRGQNLQVFPDPYGWDAQLLQHLGEDPDYDPDAVSLDDLQNDIDL